MSFKLRRTNSTADSPASVPCTEWEAQITDSPVCDRNIQYLR